MMRFSSSMRLMRESSLDSEVTVSGDPLCTKTRGIVAFRIYYVSSWPELVDLIPQRLFTPFHTAPVVTGFCHPRQYSDPNTQIYFQFTKTTILR